MAHRRPASLFLLVVRLPIWEREIVVLYGRDYARLQKVLHTFGYDPITDDVLDSMEGLCWNGTFSTPIIWLRDIHDLPTLAHEAMHAVFHVLRRCGVAHSEDSEESYLYTLTFLLAAIRDGKWKRVPR